MLRSIFPSRAIFRARSPAVRSFTVSTFVRKDGESSVEDIRAQQHSGSRKAPEPTAETGTSTQAPHDAPASNPPTEKAAPSSAEYVGTSEPGSGKPMAHNEDGDGKLESNSPFRAAPLEKSIGARTVPPDLEASERSKAAERRAKKAKKEANLKW